MSEKLGMFQIFATGVATQIWVATIYLRPLQYMINKWHRSFVYVAGSFRPLPATIDYCFTPCGSLCGLMIWGNE